ncbi:hypothetical protein GCM10007881_66030 [Mesorhizobium huakuii]|nr:hypothetical protein GCM10007881_66030 [Mesorhizobium huakuii]
MKRPRNVCQSDEKTLSPRNRAVDCAFLDRTALLFEQRNGRKLTAEDARKIVEKTSPGSLFFRLLAEWENMD